MPFIPHTEDDVQHMLSVIGAKNTNDLFDEIPKDLLIESLANVPSGLTEMEVGQLMKEREEKDSGIDNYIGAGAYDHHIPAAVWDIVSRGEFMTAYTPYQAEASQGGLQVIYEFQTMMTRLMAMEVSNASLYDGATSLAEAVLMAVRCQPKIKAPRVLVPKTTHPFYRATLRSMLKYQAIEVIECDYDPKLGIVNPDNLMTNTDNLAAVVIPQPNFFGCLEAVDQITDWAHSKGALVVGVVSPIAMTLLTPPGEWGEQGADIVCGEGQPLGVPLASGGPYFGFLCCRLKLVRQMPGRIVGRTVDSKGRPGFSLTLQAREQHIRRAKARSNICTNQGLAVTAATIYMSLMGDEGLHRVATHSHHHTQQLQQQLCAVAGVETVFSSPFFHEAVICLPNNSQQILNKLVDVGIVGGYDLSECYPELKNCILICATETKTHAQLSAYQQQLQQIVNALSSNYVEKV